MCKVGDKMHNKQADKAPKGEKGEKGERGDKGQNAGAPQQAAPMQNPAPMAPNAGQPPQGVPYDNGYAANNNGYAANNNGYGANNNGYAPNYDMPMGTGYSSGPTAIAIANGNNSGGGNDINTAIQNLSSALQSINGGNANLGSGPAYQSLYA